ncbi:MAG: hypothetical protein WC260_02455 [Candidatus Pacearchaeota archaeon]
MGNCIICKKKLKIFEGYKDSDGEYCDECFLKKKRDKSINKKNEPNKKESNKEKDVKSIDKSKPITLKVVEALQDDTYKCIARIDSPIMRKLNLDRGDIISIKGERESFCIVDSGSPEDSGEDIIRIDSITRKNIKSRTGKSVEIRKVDNIPEAKEIVLGSLQQRIIIEVDFEAIKTNLLGKPFNKDDILILGNLGERRDLKGEEFQDFFSDIFSQMEIKIPVEISQDSFIVISTNPPVPCIVSEKTNIILQSNFNKEDLIPKESLIEILNKPDTKDFIQVKDIKDLIKIASGKYFINKFQDNQKIIYTVLNYFFEIKINKKNGM